MDILGLLGGCGSYSGTLMAALLFLSGQSPAVLPQEHKTCPGHNFLFQHQGYMWEVQRYLVPGGSQDTLIP